MADIYYYVDGDSDCPDGVYREGDAITNPDDLLPPIRKLEKYALSENIFNRQYIARNILDTLRLVSHSNEDVQNVLKVMSTLENDAEPTVRAELMEQVPHIAMFCQEFKSKSRDSANWTQFDESGSESLLSEVVAEHLLPMVVKFLMDHNNQVRKTSQAALLVLLEQALVDRHDVKEQVCPVIIRLTDSDSSDDFRTEAVALLSKMAPLIGKEMTEEIFLERFAALCLDPLFHVRKVCAANFGDFSSVVGTESTEKVLLSKFIYLCDDGVWGVRKTCADVFMPVSCVCSSKIRRSDLSPVFINLLRDQSRWVKMSAFQALGPFISTFADNSLTALMRNDNGEIVIADRDIFAQHLDDLERKRAEEMANDDGNTNDEQENSVTVVDEVASDEDTMDTSTDDNEHLEKRVIHPASEANLSLEEERAKLYDKSADQYNNFLYWREPVPVLDDIPADEQPSGSASGDRGDPEGRMWSNYPVITFQTYDDLSGEGLKAQKDSATAGLGVDMALPRGQPLTQQSIVPQLLVDYYVSMADPSRAQTVDSDIAHHCAFALPAVALTLGRSNWPQLRSTYEALALDMQWKVRRTLASSLHELGIILGSNMVCQDLVPIFNGLIKDLDEVRIGILAHLADFMRLLPTEERDQYLPRLSEFLKLDNVRNWRFRLELTEQLGLLVPLYSAKQVETHLVPIASVLVEDRVAAVRISAVNALTIIVKTLTGTECGMARIMVANLAATLVHSDLWTNRQTFAMLAHYLFEAEAMQHFHFAQNVLPNVLEMAEDKVPNVRLAVARMLSIVQQETYYLTDANPSHDKMIEVIKSLSEDRDVDVRAFFTSSNELYYSDVGFVEDVSSLPV